MRYGLPKKILSDKGGQFASADPRGMSDFEDYVARLGIKVIFGKRPQAKGKIERRFEFIQRDDVLEHLPEPNLEALDDAFTHLFFRAWGTGPVREIADQAVLFARKVAFKRRYGGNAVIEPLFFLLVYFPCCAGLD